ncbi:Ig-like domain-containing protein [[Ruminococcus] torques]|uniref:Ig-like domain-containing protein n=2 Tax=[Ruminococcus] torques TaxID=33039 RepID=UPI0039948054
MKKRMFHKGMAAVLAVSLTTGGALPFMAQTVHAEDTAAEQGQIPEKKSGVVTLEKTDGSYVFGNEYLKRTFSLSADKVLSTKEITNYRTGTTPTVFTPQAGSEEFIINTLDNNSEGEDSGFVAPKKKLDTNGWTAEADSVATNEGANGGADKMFDGKNDTYYHSKYNEGTDAERKYPHNIYVDFGAEKSFQSLRYQQRVDAQGNPTVSGHVKSYKIYTGDSIDALKQATDAQPVAEGSFDNKKETYVNLKEKVTAKCVRIEFVDCHDPSDSNVSKDVACCSEFDFFEDTATFPEATDDATQLKTSEMKVQGEPELTEKDGVKTLTFTFEPKRVRGVDYTIKEVITMKDGDSFMRKRLDISVGEGQAEKAKIDYIDLENMQISQDDLKKDEYWSIKDNMADNPDMGGMKGDYLELGQPYYVGAMYWGCEFPETENKIKDSNSFIRYYYGKSLKSDDKFEYNEGNENGKMTTWDAVVGAARSRDYSVTQSDFYEYIETIAIDTEFRQQYNSWYDNMKEITDEIIQKSFFEIEKGFTQYGIAPLDSYVVDDGWTNYSSFWDFNDKFPNELYNSSLQVNQLASNFGLWLGPRGGYGTEREIANWIAQNGFGSVNRQSGSDINISDARYLTKLNKEIFCEYQDKFDINYWKLDGMLLNPSTEQSEYYVTGNPLYTISETYERWTDIFEDMRDNRAGKDLWLNMTSYTNPSPWHVQWVNSVWMQNTGDTGYTNSFNATDEEAMLTYRDNAYYNFLNEREWQLPNKYFYNHDPVYGLTANDAYHRPDIKYTDDEMRNHLYMLGTRGTAFWEYYYSYSMFDDNKWQINAEAAKWIEDNFDILQKSQMFGGKPNDGNVYGYSCWNGKEGILSIRNPKNEAQSYKVTYDRLIGVGEDLGTVYGKVVVGDQRHQTDEPLTYGKEVTYTLNPKEVLILQFGEKDETPAKILSVEGNGKEAEVEFDETIRTPEAGMFKVDGYEVTKAELKADRRTVKLTLDKELKDARTVSVSVDGVTDTVGNTSKVSAQNDAFKDGIITGVISDDLKDGAVSTKAKYSVDGHGGFTVTGKIKTDSKDVVLAEQKGAYKVGIDSEGYLTFEFNNMKITSKYDQKTVDKANDSFTSETKGIAADGKEHQFSAVKEINGMIKLYLDGKVVASTYSEDKANPEIAKGETIFAQGLTKDEVSYITVLDRSLAYDEVKDLIDTEDNVVLAKNNPKVKVTAYDATANTAVAEKPDRPFNMVNDGVKSTANYLELTDTSDSQNHSRYVQFDLGDEYDLTKIHMTRYWDGSRKYGPTVIQLSTDENFAADKTTTVYNSDKDNVHKQGAGKDEFYVETAAGKEMWNAENSEPVTARYIRVYVNGRENNQGTSDHIVEFEAYGAKDGGAIIRPDRPEEPEKPVLTGVTASVEKAELKVGETTKATATIMPEGAEGVELAWTSSDDKIATVDKDGNVKAVAEGTATLTVTATQGSGDGAVTKTATVDVTVIKDGGTDPEPEKPVLTGVKASVEKAELKVGETTKATATIMPEGAEGVELAWTSSDDKIATVDKDGNVKAVAEGTATLTVTATQGSGDGAVTKTATVDVTVIKDGGTDPEPEKPVVLTGVKASVKKADLKVGETTKATAKITPEKAENVTFAWASSDKKVATVDADGNVKAVGKGTAKLTVTATQGSGADAVKVTDTVKVTVTKDGGQTPQEDGKTPPKTGDETAPFFPFVLALAAGAVVMITRKKNG